VKTVSKATVDAWAKAEARVLCCARRAQARGEHYRPLSAENRVVAAKLVHAGLLALADDRPHVYEVRS